MRAKEHGFCAQTDEKACTCHSATVKPPGNERAEQALEKADHYGVEKSKELRFVFPLQRHFESLLSGSEELLWLCGAATLGFKQRKNSWV